MKVDNKYHFEFMDILYIIVALANLFMFAFLLKCAWYALSL